MSGGERGRPEPEPEEARNLGAFRLRQRAEAAYREALGDGEPGDFERHYIGSYPDLARWAEGFMEDMGWWEQLECRVDHRLLPHLRVDFAALGRELSYDAHVIHDDGEPGGAGPAVHVFRLHA